MRINTAHYAKIEAALAEVNGNAEAHTFGQYCPHEAAMLAERKLDALDIPQKDRVGARMFAVSSEPVAKKYRSPRTGTQIEIVRGTRGNWFMTNAQSCMLWPNEGGTRRLILTPAQDAAAVAVFRDQYRVLA